MSCYPPRDPRLRYPAPHYAPAQQTAEQPLTTSIPSSERYSKRSLMKDPASSESLSSGHGPAGHDDRSQQKRRAVSGSIYNSRPALGNGKDHFQLDTQRYHQSNIIDHHRDWDGRPSTNISTAKPPVARSIRNGTDRTSYEVNILPIRPSGKPLPRVLEFDVATGGCDPMSAEERSRSEKRREENQELLDPRVSKGRHDEYEKSISTRHSSYAHSPSSATGATFDRKHRPKGRPRRSGRDRPSAAESIRKEGMDADKVEEEITCPMYVSLLLDFL